jgi:hypothetical protein
MGSTCIKPLGAACVAGGECASGRCTEGVCCDLSACGTCASCKVASFVGTCHVLPAGTTDSRCVADPVATCQKDGTCNGSGACRLYPAGTSCVAASCMGSQHSNARDCDGAGTCRDNGTVDCSPYTCNPGTGNCFVACDASSSQCCCGKLCQIDLTCQ